VRDRSRAFDEISEVCRRRGEPLRDAAAEEVRAALARPEITFIAARDESGQPLAHAAVVIDDTICLIFGAVACGYEARWALHDHIVQTLIARRVTYLLAEGGGPFGALGSETNIQHYQHLLGYELRHLIPAPLDAMTWTRRRLVCLVVAAVTTVTLSVPDAAGGATAFM
jgi:hypothetical protein